MLEQIIFTRSMEILLILNLFAARSYFNDFPKMKGSAYLKNLLLWWIACNNFATMLLAMPRPKDYHGGSGEVVSSKFDTVGNSEPSCEELKAMWRFSKRQSRAAEVTNEIPTYRDPFSYNVWNPYYARSRSGGGIRTVTRSNNRPVYGIIIHEPRSFRVQDIAERNRAFEDFTRYYGNSPSYEEPRKGQSAVRLVGGGVPMPQMMITPQSGSFQHLKELIRTERARELQEQRMAEEIAARAATLKDMSGRLRDRNRQHQNGIYMNNNNNDKKPRDEQEERLSSSSRMPAGVLAFPNLLAPGPAIRHERGEPYTMRNNNEKFKEYYEQELAQPHFSMYNRNFYNDMNMKSDAI